MQRCPRCHTFIEAGWGYCPVCGRPRILESLRVPEAQPAWHEPALKGLVALVTVWFLITVGVAFLREWKAVRDSRELLDQGETQQAWNLLESFLPRHPEHRQAVFLSGKAAIRLDKYGEARQLLDKLAASSSDLAEELGAEYRQELAGRAQSLGCNVPGFQALLGSAEMIGPAYAEAVMSGLSTLVQQCRASGNDYGVRTLAAALSQNGRALGLVQHGYAPAILSAVEQRRYDEAQELARQAGYLVPEGWPVIEEALSGERRKVSETVATITRLCEEIGADPQFRDQGSWCFPVQAPPGIIGVRDAWGGQVLYRPLVQGKPSHCFHGFALTSYGADGVETHGDSATPSMEIVCGYRYGNKHWQRPAPFWHLPQE